MPIYEFRCNACDHKFEELCSFDDDGSQQKCPQCGHVGARRLVSVFAAHGLENGHHGVGKRWGNTSGSGSGDKGSGSDSGSKSND
ncbi:MAG: zinc ribbon domain-containing protein [Bacillota bacterium]|nr:MAG: zinc ribbon domain-containing protein [Bacillota bacterium]